MFKQQYVSGRCAAFAIHAVLQVQGIEAELDDIVRAGGQILGRVYKEGMSEQQIIRALKAFNNDAKEHYCTSRATLYKALHKALQRQHPVVLDVENAVHWAALLGSYGKRFAWYDSMDSDLVGIYTEKELGSWIETYDENYFIEVIPHNHSFVGKIPEEYFTDGELRFDLIMGNYLESALSRKV
jgi:hypothetical protein